MSAQLIKNGDYWYLKNNKGRNKLLPNEFQNSPLLQDSNIIEAAKYNVIPEFSKFSSNINSPLQFIRFLETILHFGVNYNESPHILEPAISYIQNIAFNKIIKCPNEIIIILLSENIEHIKDANKLFSFIDVIYHLVDQYMFEKNLFNQYYENTNYNYYDNYHLLHLCAKHDFKEYFIFIFSDFVYQQNHGDDYYCMLLISILVINNSKKIFNYLLSNIIENDEILEDFFYAERDTISEATEHIKQIFYSTRFYCRIEILFCFATNRYCGSNSYIMAYTVKEQPLIALDENMIIQLLQLYKYVILSDKIIYDITEQFTLLIKDYKIKNLFIMALNTSIKYNYYTLFTYLLKKCSDLIFPIMLVNDIKIDIFNIIAANNVQFILDLYHSKLNNCVTGFTHTLFIDHIKRDISKTKLYDTIISIDMLQIFIEIFDDYSINIFNLCGNIETVLYYYNQHNTYLSIEIIDKMMKYKCTVDELDIVLNKHIDYNKSQWGHVIPRYIISYIIIYERDDLYEYIVAKYIQYGEYIYIFDEMPITSFVSVNVDYFISKLQHLLQIKKIFISASLFHKLIELCFLNITFIQVIDMCYDYILEYKPYLYKKQCSCPILCQFCSKIEDFYIHYILNDITKYMTIDTICRRYEIISSVYIYRLIIICNTFYNNYKKFNHFYKKVPQLFKSCNINIISKSEIDSMQKYLLDIKHTNDIQFKDFQKLQHHIKNTYVIVILQLCKKINISIANNILTYIDFYSLHMLIFRSIKLGSIHA